MPGIANALVKMDYSTDSHQRERIVDSRLTAAMAFDLGVHNKLRHADLLQPCADRSGALQANGVSAVRALAQIKKAVPVAREDQR